MKTRCFIIIAIIVIVASLAVYFVLRQSKIISGEPGESVMPTESVQPPVMTANEALTVVQSSNCLKDGITLKEGGEIFYNPNSKTWWFDLTADKAGCNPACVVSENKTAEINWRCTGLIMSNESDSDRETIRQILAAKYPKYAQTLSVNFTNKTEDHARGGISFAPEGTGGIFLAAKIDGAWQVVYDGNGAIACTLSEYGFPSDMLSDCAK